MQPLVQRNIARHLWCLGFSFITFDQALVWNFLGFNFKLSYGFFFLSLLLTLSSFLAESGLKQSLSRWTSIFLRPPSIFAMALFVLSIFLLPGAYIAKKSIAYTAWLAFDLVAIVGTAILLFSPKHNPGLERANLRGLWIKYLLASLLVLGLIVHIDYFAFFYGYRGGLIGLNQGIHSWYTNSRPHAFSYEPSYLALYFCFGLVYLLFESIISAKPSVPRWLSLPVLILSMNVILLTFARSVLITLALTIFLLVLILIRRGKLMGAKFVHLFIALSFSVVLIVALTPKSQLIAVYDRMIYRAFIGADQSVDSRLDGFRVAWNMAKIKNFVGVGIGGSYAYWYREMGGAPTVALVKLPQTVYQRHKIQSLWLEVLAELGAIGIFIFASLGFALCYQALQATRIDPGMDSYVAFVMLVVFFLFTSHWFPNLCRPDIWSWIGIWGASITYGIANDGKGSSSLGDQV